MSITETEWWQGAEKVLGYEWEAFSGYEGFDTITESTSILSALQGHAAYHDEETGAFEFCPAFEGWQEYGLDALSDSDGLVQGFQLTYYGNEDGGLYFAVFLDWKDLTFERGATGIEAARAYGEALDNARTRLDSLLENFLRKAQPRAQG